MQYRDVGSGFYVLPRIHGDIATLEITTQNDALSSDQSQSSGGAPIMRTQNSTTVISGRLGEWIAVGGVVRQGSSDNSSITTRSRSSLNEQHNVLIRVDEAN
jgi:type II secretory pathway component GspD/PulD (secretin)